MSSTIRQILDMDRNSKRSDLITPVRTVLGGTNTVRQAIKDDALRLDFDTTRDYARPGDYLDPVLAYHLRRKIL